MPKPHIHMSVLWRIKLVLVVLEIYYIVVNIVVPGILVFMSCWISTYFITTITSPLLLHLRGVTYYPLSLTLCERSVCFFQKFKKYIKSDGSLNGINLASWKSYYPVLTLIFLSIGAGDSHTSNW